MTIGRWNLPICCLEEFCLWLNCNIIGVANSGLQTWRKLNSLPPPVVWSCFLNQFYYRTNFCKNLVVSVQGSLPVIILFLGTLKIVIWNVISHLAKISWLIIQLNNLFLFHKTPGRDINESMIHSREGFIFSQYFQNKAHKYSIKDLKKSMTRCWQHL